MKVLILCLLIGSISAINQSQKDFQEVATSRVSSGCIDRLPRLPSACKNVKVTCSKLKSQCHKTLAQVVKPAGRKCQSKLRKADANKKIYQFCAGSCTTCRDGQWTAWKSTPCTKTCGSDGIQTKTRTCTNPPPTGSGNACDGSSSETIDCELKPCPKPARPTPAPKPKTTPAPKAGISLKEYQKQVDIFRKSIDGLEKKVLSQDALIQGLKQNVSTVKGDLAEEITAIAGNTDAIQDQRGRFDTLENTVVRNCSQDSDCAEPLHFCLHGWCSVVECTTDSHCTSSSKPKCYNNICACSSDLDCERSNEYCDTDDHSCTTFSGYNFEQFGFCTGDSGDFTGVSYDTLDDATNHCSGSCGCIVDGHCDGGTYYLRTGNYTNDASNWSIPPCAWVKT